MPRLLIFAAAAGLLALGGCAGMSKSQCLAGDWETVGYRDGLSGTQSAALMRYQDACVKHGVVPDRESYLAGWHEGVEQYCQPGNAFAVGERGAGYANVCPAHLQASFQAAYQDGRQLYLARAEIDNLNREIAQREHRLKDVKAEIAGITASLLDAEATTADRAQMVLTAKDLAEEKGQLESEIEDLQAEVAVKIDRLDDLQQSLAYAG